jgi:glycosyltransferase involved in cell wall biosynthesis
MLDLLVAPHHWATAPMNVLAVTGRLPQRGRPGSLAPVARQIESVRKQGVSVDVLELYGPKKLKYVTAWPRLLNRCRSVDIVHAHFGYSGWLALLQWQCPVVISFMGTDLLGNKVHGDQRSATSRLVLRLNRFASERSNAVIVKSREMASVLTGLNPHVIPNGVNMTRFSPVERLAARARLGWPEEELVALFPGCPTFPNKGYDIAKDAVSHAIRILGRSIELKVLWGVAPDDVPLYMSASNAMILASRQEGSPNVVKEALACELPVVATAVGDVPDLLADAVGCHVCDRTAVALGEALAKALILGRLTCGRTILTKLGLDEDSVATRVIALYHAVLASKEARV